MGPTSNYKRFTTQGELHDIRRTLHKSKEDYMTLDFMHNFYFKLQGKLHDIRRLLAFKKSHETRVNRFNHDNFAAHF